MVAACLGGEGENPRGGCEVGPHKNDRLFLIALFLIGIGAIAGTFIFLSHVERIDEDGYHYRR